MQLIYRWTKSLDPSLKKGFWAPEEDAVSVWPWKPRRAIPGCEPRCPPSLLKWAVAGCGGYGCLQRPCLFAFSPAEVASSSCQIWGAGLV